MCCELSLKLLFFKLGWKLNEAQRTVAIFVVIWLYQLS